MKNKYLIILQLNLLKKSYDIKTQIQYKKN